MKLSEIKTIDQMKAEIKSMANAISYDVCVETSVRKLVELLLWGAAAYEYMLKIKHIKHSEADPVTKRSLTGSLSAIISRSDDWPFKRTEIQYEDEGENWPQHLRGTNVLEDAMALFNDETRNYLRSLLGDDHWCGPDKENTIDVQIVQEGCDIAWKLVDRELIPKDGLIADSLRIAIYNLDECVCAQEKDF